MKAEYDDQSTSRQEQDQRALAHEADAPVSEPECPVPEDEGQTIEEPGYGHGV